MASDFQKVARGAAALLAERIAAMRAPGWQPLPHQIPPTGDWAGWALIAGRGAGKTDTCAHYVAEHVKGPPCLPGPSPHWIGIIAPTLADAATSCYAGPSGLRVHSPDARLVQRIGGAMVVWPNGSEAKLFGAHTPEDVERLRSGGNRSILKGTLIHTDRGRIPIEQVTTDDRVWTRNGLRPVLWSGSHGTRPIWTLRTASGRVLKLTPDHKVWTNRGMIRCDQLSLTDTLSLWNGTVTAGSDLARTGHAVFVSEIGTERSCCIERSTNTTMAPSRTAGTFITRTTTSPTTIRETWRPDHQAATTGSTQSLRSGTRREDVQPSGTPFLTDHASTAERSSTGIEALGSVVGNAGALLSVQQRPDCLHASCAEAISRCSGSRSPSLAPDPVEIVSPGNIVGPVWDLTVAGEHEFFADGLLVSNCLNWYEELAAWRYLDEAWAHARFGLRTGTHPRWIASTTPKPRPLIKRLMKDGMSGAVLTRASYRDNPHLPQHVKDALEEEYGGTQLGRQELEGELIEQDENALWTHEGIEAARVNPNSMPKLTRITVGVDPSGGAGEQGIVVSGRATVQTPLEGRTPAMITHGFVLADRTVHLTPDGWARRAVQAAVDYDADDIVVERNYGGDMAVTTLRSAADSMGIPIPIRVVWASNGKKVRASPVAALTEQLRWHHAGVFPELENQMCTWTPELDWSPDRIDACVWGAHHNKVVQRHPSVGQKAFSSAVNRRIG